MKKVVCLVPLRGGSKSIPKKNIRPFCGKPLACWILEAALGCSDIDEVWVSTDSVEIRETIAARLPAVRFCTRDPETATDTASTESVMLDFMNQVEFDLLITAQATSPTTKTADFSEALEKFNREAADSLLTGVREKRFYWTLDGKPLNYDPLTRPRRQDFDGTLVENGAFYITKRSLLESTRCRLGGKIVVHEMSADTFHEIDEPEDLLKLAGHLSARRLADIRMIVCDVDGTLTDGGMYYSGEGDLFRKFNTRDARGLADLADCGVQVVLLSGENSPITIARARKLGISECHVGVKEKLPFLLHLLGQKGLALDQVAYVGDDTNDLDCLKAVGFAACPADADPRVLKAADFISSFTGGRGAVRDICDHIIQHQRPDRHA